MRPDALRRVHFESPEECPKHDAERRKRIPTQSVGTRRSHDHAPLIPFEALKPGDHVKITQRIKVGLKIWTTTVTGTVERTERRREGLAVKRNFDDKAFADLILLKKDGPVGEETTVAMDEYTHIERA